MESLILIALFPESNLTTTVTAEMAKEVMMGLDLLWLRAQKTVQ